MTQIIDDTTTIERLLAIVRLGDADRLGWWRSHSLDDTAEYVLGTAFPSTWKATGIELAMESARVLHEQLLERSTAIHILSDYLPYDRLLRNWADREEARTRRRAVGSAARGQHR